MRMAKNVANIELTGWLNDVRDFHWGRALKVSVDQRKKNEAGEWETVDKTIYDVTTDSQAPLEGVKQVTITGRITGTSTFQKRDGSTGSAVKVRAETIEPVSDQLAQKGHAAVKAVWPEAQIGPAETLDLKTPF
jgi:hypothetical protein